LAIKKPLAVAFTTDKGICYDVCAGQLYGLEREKKAVMPTPQACRKYEFSGPRNRQIR